MSYSQRRFKETTSVSDVVSTALTEFFVNYDERKARTSKTENLKITESGDVRNVVIE